MKPYGIAVSYYGDHPLYPCVRVFRSRHGYGKLTRDQPWRRSAMALGLLILRAQRREDPPSIDGIDHPTTCRRRCCR